MINTYSSISIIGYVLTNYTSEINWQLVTHLEIKETALTVREYLERMEVTLNHWFSLD